MLDISHVDKYKHMNVWIYLQYQLIYFIKNY